MKPKRIDIDPVAVDPDGLAKAQAVVAAGALSLDGDLISGGAYSGDYARQLGVLSAADDSLITFTIVGTDSDGKALTEVVTGSAGAPGTAETTGYFLTVASVTASAAAAGNVSVGTVDEISSQVFPIDFASGTPCTIGVDATGVVNFTVQETFDNFQRETNCQSVQWFNISGLTEIANTDTLKTATAGATGIRLLINSYTTGAELQIYISHPVR